MISSVHTCTWKCQSLFHPPFDSWCSLCFAPSRDTPPRLQLPRGQRNWGRLETRRSAWVAQDCWELGLLATCCCYGYRRAGLVGRSGLNGACFGASHLLLYLVHQFATLNAGNAVSVPITERNFQIYLKKESYSPLIQTRLFRIAYQFPWICFSVIYYQLFWTSVIFPPESFAITGFNCISVAVKLRIYKYCSLLCWKKILDVKIIQKICLKFDFPEEMINNPIEEIIMLKPFMRD